MNKSEIFKRVAKELLSFTLQSIFISLLAFVIMDVALMRVVHVEKSVGGNINFYVVIGVVVLICAILRMLVSHCFPSQRLRRISLSLLLHFGSIYGFIQFDTYVLIELSGYWDFTVIFHAATLILSLLIPTTMQVKAAGVAAVAIVLGYLGVVFLLPLGISRHIGVISGDWAVLNALRKAESIGLSCEKMMQDPDFFPNEDDRWSCDFTNRIKMIPRYLAFYPEAVLHWGDDGRLIGYDLNWRPYD
jgi:hypothetical protein